MQVFNRLSAHGKAFIKHTSLCPQIKVSTKKVKAEWHIFNASLASHNVSPEGQDDGPITAFLI